MTEHSSSDNNAPKKSQSPKDARAERLSQALRDNLRRRKVQKRSRKVAEAGGAIEDKS